MDEASADLLSGSSQRGRAPCGLILLVTQSDPATTWSPCDDDDRALASRSRSSRSRERQAAEIVEIATDDAARWHLTSSRRSRAARAATSCSSSSCSTCARSTGMRRATGLGRGGDRRRHRPALAARPRSCCATPRCSGRASTAELLAAALRDEVGARRAASGASAAARRPRRERAPALPQHAGPRHRLRRACPFRRRRELHARVAEAIESAAAVARGRGGDARAPLRRGRSAHDKAWHYAPGGRRPRAGGRRERRGGAVLRARPAMRATTFAA